MTNRVSFNYSKLKETDVKHSLFLLFENIPECVVSAIASFLLPQKDKTINIVYESKAEDYRQTKDTYYDTMIMSRYDFIIVQIKALVSKHYKLNHDNIFPHTRADINYFNSCNIDNDAILTNRRFFLVNRWFVLSLFIELYSDFKEADVYFCLYENFNILLNKKYRELLAQNHKDLRF